MPVVRCSARTGEGVTEAFTQLTRKCIAKFGKTKTEVDRNNAIEDIRAQKEKFRLQTGKQ